MNLELHLFTIIEFSNLLIGTEINLFDCFGLFNYN